jgi:drug/metabolite transporter (DMT)-like permease
MPAFMSAFAGPLFVLVFTLSQAFRDVYFGSVFQRFDFFAVLFLAFALSTVIFGVVALIRAPGDFRKLRGQGGTVIMVNLTTALAWSSYFFALTYIDPSVVNTIHSAMGPLVVVVLGAFGVALAQQTATGTAERIGYAGIALSVVALWVVVLGGYGGFAQKNLSASIAGLALLTVSGTSITISLLYCKRLQDSGVGADALTTVRYITLIVFAAVMMVWHVKPLGIDVPSQAVTLGIASLLLLVLPLYSLQVGIGRTSPLTANIVRALSPVLVFALEQFDGRMRYSTPVLVCILIYSASVILSNVARGWRDERAPAVGVGG